MTCFLLCPLSQWDLGTSCLGPFVAASRCSKLSKLSHRSRAERGWAENHSNVLRGERSWVAHWSSLFPAGQTDFSASNKTAQQRFVWEDALNIFLYSFLNITCSFWVYVPRWKGFASTEKRLCTLKVQETGSEKIWEHKTHLHTSWTAQSS